MKLWNLGRSVFGRECLHVTHLACRKEPGPSGPRCKPANERREAGHFADAARMRGGANPKSQENTILHSLKSVSYSPVSILGSTPVCASYGVCAVEDLLSHHRAAQRRCESTHALLCRSVPHHGLLATYMARVVARHRGVSGSQPLQAISHGRCSASRPFHTRRCAEPARLAHLSCAGSASDRPRQSAVCPRPLGPGPRRKRLCAGFYRHRLMPEFV